MTASSVALKTRWSLLSVVSQRVIILWVVILLTFAGFALRMYGINRVPLRGDEAFTMIHWVRQPLDITLAEIATRDPQPPLAYAIYHLWGQMVGDDSDTVRFLPALINVIGVPILYALGAHMGGRRIGLLAAMLWAFHPAQIWHAQDARNYALWGAASPLALWLALRAVRHRRPVDWILYIGAAGTAAYLYYLELFVIAVLNLAILWTYRKNRRLLIQWITSQIIVAGALAVWFLQERLLFGSGYGGTAGAVEPLRLLTWFIPGLMLGETFPYVWLMVFSPICLAILVYGFRRIRHARFLQLLLALLIVFPLFAIALVSFRLNVFVPRYVLSITVPVIILCAFALSLHSSGRRRLTVFLFLIFGFSISLTNFYFNDDYTKSPDWIALTQYLDTGVQPADVIVNTSADEAYTFYQGEAGINNPLLRLPANPDQSQSEIETSLSNTSDGLWLVADTPADWPNRGVAESWLAAYRQPIIQTRINGLRAEYWLPYPTPAPEQIVPQAIFPVIAHITDVRIISNPALNTLVVAVTWQPLQPTTTPLKVFVHLMASPSALPYAQDDQFPGDGTLNSTTWGTDDLFRDVYTLALDGVPLSQYMLHIGLYDPENGQRMLTNLGIDHVMIGRVDIPLR